MKNSVLLLSALAVLSCENQNKLTYTEKRMIGSWAYDDVRFTENWSIGSNNITDAYDDFTLTFNDDFTMTSINPATGETYSGIWEINVISDYNSTDNSSSANEQLIASLKNDQTGEMEQIIWDDLSVNNKRINSYNSNKEGHYRFRLEKLE